MTYAYDPGGNLLTTTGKTPLEPSPRADSFSYNDASQLTSFGYGCDMLGRLTTAPSRTFTYDSASRLTSIRVGGSMPTFTYNGLEDLRTRRAAEQVAPTQCGNRIVRVVRETVNRFIVPTVLLRPHVDRAARRRLRPGGHLVSADHDSAGRSRICQASVTCTTSEGCLEEVALRGCVTCAAFSAAGPEITVLGARMCVVRVLRRAHRTLAGHRRASSFIEPRGLQRLRSHAPVDTSGILLLKCSEISVDTREGIRGDIRNGRVNAYGVLERTI